MSELEREGATGPAAAVLSVVIVTHNSREAIESSLPALISELRESDELIVVDNRSADGTAGAARELAPDAQVVEGLENLGYGGGCNAGAELATGELLLFLNPDAIVQTGFREAIELPLRDGRGWAAWQALVRSEDGAALNSAGGVIHFTGIAWAGGDGEALGTPGEPSPEPGEVAFASGTCLAVRRDDWNELGGFPEGFFLYHEDVDLSLRLRLAEQRVGIEPRAIVNHAYEFEKGPAKWRQLERNRWATIIRTYPTRLIAILFPALVATELALLPVSIAGGWLTQKLRSWIDLMRAAPRLLRSRREVQARRTVATADFARYLSPDLDSQHLGRVGRSKTIGWLLRGYWALARVLLGRRRGDV